MPDLTTNIKSGNTPHCGADELFKTGPVPLAVFYSELIETGPAGHHCKVKPVSDSELKARERDLTLRRFFGFRQAGSQVLADVVEGQRWRKSVPRTERSLP